MNIINLGKLIDPLEFDQYIVEAEKLETVVHTYGEEFNIPEHPCWMEYKNKNKESGTISFSRHTFANPILKEMILKIVDVLNPILSDSADLKKVHFIRTIGKVPVHRDEGGRMCCINIGLKNSSSAITKISNDGLLENFLTNNNPYIIEDGVGYLLNTNQFHSVEGDLHTPRYLITYGFSATFEILKKAIRIL